MNLSLDCLTESILLCYNQTFEIVLLFKRKEYYIYNYEK